MMSLYASNVGQITLLNMNQPALILVFPISIFVVESWQNQGVGGLTTVDLASSRIKQPKSRREKPVLLEGLYYYTTINGFEY